MKIFSWTPRSVVSRNPPPAAFYPVNGTPAVSYRPPLDPTPQTPPRRTDDTHTHTATTDANSAGRRDREFGDGGFG